MRGWLLLLIVFISGFPVAAQAECALPAQLVAGNSGEVRFTDGEPLNVRREAGRAAEVVGTLREGLRFRVLSEPVCSGGIVWREIEADALTGWIAEGVDDVYFVRPLTPALLEAEAELAAAPVFDLSLIDPAARLLVLNGNTRQLTDGRFNPLLTLPEGTSRTMIAADAVSAFVVATGELYTAHRADDNTYDDGRLPVPPELDGKDFLGAAISPDGEQIAWLYSDCESIFGCPPDTGYALSLTDADGNDRRVVWEGIPSDVGRFGLAGWRSDSAAVFIELSGEAPYPEPGSPVYSEPGYPPEGDVIEIPITEAAQVDDRERRFAISDDGEWEVDRETGSGINELYVRTRDGETQYAVPYPGYRLATQFTFSPGNSTLVWAQANYTDYEFNSAALMALDLQTGALTTLYEFPNSYMFEQGWLAENLLLVRWADLQWNVDYQLIERTKGLLVFDVNSGEVWRLPDDVRLLRAYPG